MHRKKCKSIIFPGDIENINQVIGIYEKYDKKLLSTFYLLINFCREKKYSRRAKHKTFDRKYKKRASIFTWIKKFRHEKKSFGRKAKKKFFLMRNFFFDMKLFLVRIFFLI